MTGFFSRPAAPTVIWSGAVALAWAASLLGAEAAAVVAAACGIVGIALLKARTGARVLLGLAVAPAVFIDAAPVWTWIGAGAALGLASGVMHAGEGAAPYTSDLQRHLAWCRRREENSHLLVLPLTGDRAADPTSLLECFRVTDSVELSRSAAGDELYALIDDNNFDRDGLERRLAERGQRSFAWAVFPDDGLTIHALVEHARPRGREVLEDGAFTEAPRVTHLERAAGATVLSQAVGE
jgi:hypothetical protein